MKTGLSLFIGLVNSNKIINFQGGFYGQQMESQECFVDAALCSSMACYPGFYHCNSGRGGQGYLKVQLGLTTELSYI